MVVQVVVAESGARATAGRAVGARARAVVVVVQVDGSVFLYRHFELGEDFLFVELKLKSFI